METNNLIELAGNINSRVSITARVFDRIGPEWYKHVDPYVLDMYFYRDCIIGQAGQYLFNLTDNQAKDPWEIFRERYAPYSFRDSDKGWSRITRMGLGAFTDLEYTLLNQAWCNEILKRRELDGLCERLNV